MGRREHMNRRLFFGIFGGLLAVSLVIVAIGYMIKPLLPIFNMFQPYTLTIVNESDERIISVETGTLHSNPDGEGLVIGEKHVHSKVIREGEKVKIRPGLTMNREGGVYMTITTEDGKQIEKTVCSYAEGPSGYSVAIVSNEKIKIEEDCY